MLTGALDAAFNPLWLKTRSLPGVVMTTRLALSSDAVYVAGVYGYRPASLFVLKYTR